MQRKVKEILPKTFEELKALSQDERARLWARYSPHPFNGQLRALWYYMQCRTAHIHLETKYLNKLKKYKSVPTECANLVYRHRYNLTPRGNNHQNISWHRPQNSGPRRQNIFIQRQNLSDLVRRYQRNNWDKNIWPRLLRIK